MALGSRPSILLVDNDRDAAATLAALLTNIGCHVCYTFDPRLALLLARKCKPDIAFLDLRMPHLTGFHLAAAFRVEKALADCALVALSAYGGDAYREASMTAGFAAFLRKPATLGELAAVLDRLVPATQAVSA